MYRGVVFDLWQTLAVWPEQKSSELRRAWSEELGVSAAILEELWLGADFYRRRETGPIASAVAALYERLGVDADVRGVVARRLEITREALVPVEGAVSTLRELRRRGVATAIVSNCTEEVALVWEHSAFSGLVDFVVFSATAGCMKPEPQIYGLALAELDCKASECLFVGDGANDELRGAEEVGMTPVLVSPDGEEPRWDGLQDWRGLRIGSIPQVLDLVG
ncbi:MAG TPA: HAD family hydrolase [Gaiellaceae bacterium]|nr:HAD family hydrolase [Gaiellaceae bacterium]